MSFLPKIIAMQICGCNTILCVCFLGWGTPAGRSSTSSPPALAGRT